MESQKITLFQSETLQRQLDRIEETNSKILEKLDNKDEPGIVGDFISEAKAKIKFSRGSTWFWEQRQKGLSSIEVGQTHWYKMSELFQFFSDKKNKSRTSLEPTALNKQ